jgi:hypothetical protein
MLQTKFTMPGIDYSISNERMGEETFGGKCLHLIEEGKLNPYQTVQCFVFHS